MFWRNVPGEISGEKIPKLEDKMFLKPAKAKADISGVL